MVTFEVDSIFLSSASYKSYCLCSNTDCCSNENKASCRFASLSLALPAPKPKHHFENKSSVTVPNTASSVHRKPHNL